MTSEPDTDPPLTPEQAAIAASLSPDFVARVDAALLRHAKEYRRKVAMLVGLTIMDESLRIAGLPDVYFAGRVKELVKQGLLVAEGRLDCMRFSQVRLPKTEATTSDRGPMWHDVEYVSIELGDPRQVAVLDALKRQYVNGGVLLRAFDARDPATFENALRNDRNGTRALLATLFASPSAQRVAPELALDTNDFADAEFHFLSTYGFEGELTARLLGSGAYVRSTLGEDEARSMSRDFVDSLIGDDRHTVSVWRIEGAWTSWHYDVAWDSTFVLQVPQHHRWILLCATDTD